MDNNTIKDTKTEYTLSNEIDIIQSLIKHFENDNQLHSKAAIAQIETLTPKMKAALAYTLKYHQNVYLALKNR